MDAVVAPSTATSHHPAKHRSHAVMLRLCTAVFVAMLVVCLGWTLWLMALTLVPNESANKIMGTASLDRGTFWHFSDRAKVVGSLGVAGLGVAALGFVYVLCVVLRIPCGRRPRLCWRSSKVTTSSSPTAHIDRHSALQLALRRPTASLTKLLEHRTARSLRHHTNAIVKIGDLVLHMFILVQLLEAGMPTTLVIVFAAVATVHALVFAVVLATPHNHVQRLHLVLDTFFDLTVAIGFPTLVLVHSVYLFKFDMALMAINMSAFPPGTFERYAAAVADPLEVVGVRQSLASLQVNSVVSKFTRVGTMLALTRRLWQLARVLDDVRIGRSPDLRIYCGRHRGLGTAFVLAAVCMVVFTEESIRTAALACQPHPECAQHAHRWIFSMRHDDLTRCPCLTMVDRNTMVSMHHEWAHPPNCTAKVAQLATAGLLQTLQLVNRGLTSLPDELRRCKHLRHVSLYYTHTESLPDWFGEFSELEFLHIEGKYPRSSLMYIPENMLDNMSELTFLHIAMHGLESLPSLDGLEDLKSLSLVALPHVTALPRFTSLRSLEQLTVNMMALVQTFPDLSKLQQLTSMTVVDRGSFCCNGFLGPDKCHLSHSMCQYHDWSNAPAITHCVSSDQVATTQTRAAFDRFNMTACYGEAIPAGVVITDPSPDNVAQCNGTLYRQCHLAGSSGTAMCYNTRWMVIACDDYPFAIEMRRQQIKSGLGVPCNPEYEAWLGCQ